jgi:prevent-host-death family protein
MMDGSGKSGTGFLKCKKRDVRASEDMETACMRTILPIRRTALHESISVRYNVRMQTFITATEARKTFYDMIERSKKPGHYAVITHEGLPATVMMSFEEFEEWQETLDVMSDPDLATDVREGVKEWKSGKRPADTISLEELKKNMRH